ncbi:MULTISPECIES: enoyl-CoA hydratase/isomerase family protein [Myroides]|uniref:3-hydroxyisobutyryl-CoA hydrolase n=1 Tax=Myroides albus TaxID=2562892 RepID=A0A6I3LQK0_9FLAO|nr:MULTISPECIES: enoyl-CoA hydratase/isomerase family protein [Myroides]MTG98225.1 enoyl-CoA hydratase/isomerase family protein [Myroides albus]MVX36367.1 enoyl-CoA hydratase/isomerase family protein [Myroides sp. LoEW2-1]
MNVILSEIKNHIGIITLNSERSLNSLSLEMVEGILTLLDKWKQDDSIKSVFLQGSGEKAFCAGGDIRQMRQAIIEQQKIDPTQVPQKCADFFEKEYLLDYTIHTYAKPIIVWADGIVMGGGLGLLAGASHRIVTERSKLAMPEITIGLYPDVGASYFLNQMPSAYGLYLGMTATRFDGADALFLNLADYHIDAAHKQALLQDLTQLSWSNTPSEDIDLLLQKHSSKDIPTSQAQENESIIQEFESVKDTLAFSELLQKHACENTWVNAGYQIFKSGSPSSAFVIFKQIKDNKGKSLEQAFKSELNLSCQCSIHPDFPEGVRALLIDKDLSPKWQPSSLDKVSPEWVESYFTPLWLENEHPFKDLGK